MFPCCRLAWSSASSRATARSLSSRSSTTSEAGRSWDPSTSTRGTAIGCWNVCTPSTTSTPSSGSRSFQMCVIRLGILSGLVRMASGCLTSHFTIGCRQIRLYRFVYISIAGPVWPDWTKNFERPWRQIFWKSCPNISVTFLAFWNTVLFNLNLMWLLFGQLL